MLKRFLTIMIIVLSKKVKKIKPNIMKISESLKTKAYKGVSKEEEKILTILLLKVLKNFNSKFKILES